MNNILLLGATFGTGNMGVGALTAGALTIVSRRYPEAQVKLLDYGREPVVSVTQVDGKTLTLPLVNLRFSWKILLANNVAALILLALLTRVAGPRGRDWLLQHNPWLKTISEADAAIAVSGGDSFSDIYGLGRFFYVTLPQLLAMSLGVKLIMLPQTIGPFRHGPTRWIARFMMQNAALIYSRDKPGIDEIRKLLDSPDHIDKARFCYDMGFVVEPHLPPHLNLGGLAPDDPSDTRPLVGLNVSGLLLMGGYTRSNMFDLRVNYSDLIDRLVTHLIEDKNARVLLVPHVFGEGAESDTVAAQTVYDRLKARYPSQLFCAQGQYNQNEIKYIIGLCEFFVGSRMHACIAALSQGIPAIGVAYSDKFSGVFESVGAGNLVADPRRLTLEQTVQSVSLAFDERNSTRQRLQEVMPQIKARVIALLDDLP